MDLGILGRKAIVCASSRGLGKACAKALIREGCSVVINGRDPETLAEAQKELSELRQGSVTSVAADINTAAGRSKLLESCPERHR